MVDDAIVVGERVHAYEQKGLSKSAAAIEGTVEVSIPVIFGVLTTIAAFLSSPRRPDMNFLLFSKLIGGTVVFCLIASLLESQLILPGHIAHRKTRAILWKGLV